MPGTYVQVKFSQRTNTALMSMIEAMGIPNPIDERDLHSTIIYSRECEDSSIESLDLFEKVVIATPKQFKVYRQQDGMLCLVLEIDCPSLHARHHELLVKYNLQHSFPDYTPHITLSYNCGPAYSFHKKDPWQYLDKIEIVEELVEPLRDVPEGLSTTDDLES